MTDEVTLVEIPLAPGVQHRRRVPRRAALQPLEVAPMSGFYVDVVAPVEAMVWRRRFESEGWAICAVTLWRAQRYVASPCFAGARR